MYLLVMNGFPFFCFTRNQTYFWFVPHDVVVILLAYCCQKERLVAFNHRAALQAHSIFAVAATAISY